MVEKAGNDYCTMLRTKFSYFRAPGGVRLIDPESTTACYTCLLTQSPVGPDDLPVHASICGRNRACFTRAD
ncbi:MAG TPA: hypothetical protein VND20_04190 [Candidatus Binataceae bacterium]|nr:hypothetical protein [Candidatus Binataceae bacterium]